MKIPFRKYSEINFTIDNRWKWQCRNNVHAIWFGTEYLIGLDYGMITNAWTFCFTIANFNFNFQLIGNPQKRLVKLTPTDVGEQTFSFSLIAACEHEKEGECSD